MNKVRLWTFMAEDDLVGDPLPLIEDAQACLFDRAEVDEHVLAAVVRLNEAVSPFKAEPFDGSRSHGFLP
jgi:hypothetical protein